MLFSYKFIYASMQIYIYIYIYIIKYIIYMYIYAYTHIIHIYYRRQRVKILCLKYQKIQSLQFQYLASHNVFTIKEIKFIRIIFKSGYDRLLHSLNVTIQFLNKHKCIQLTISISTIFFKLLYLESAFYRTVANLVRFLGIIVLSIKRLDN